MSDKFIIEVRLNEYEKRENPNVPWTVDEIVAAALACHRAGAAIIHFHARTDTGRPDTGYEANAEIVRRLSAECDVVIHPTLGAVAHKGNAAERLATVEQMVAEGLKVDLAPLDFVTTNIDRFDEEAGAFRSQNKIYTNTVETLTYFATRLREIGVRPYPVACNVTAVRYMLAFYQAGLLDGPRFAQLMLSSGEHIFAHPGTPNGIRALTDFLPKDAPFAWNVYNTGGSAFTVLDYILESGGHLSAGLGDYPYVELGKPTNAQLVEKFVERARAHGREPATPAEARVIYGITPRG